MSKKYQWSKQPCYDLKKGQVSISLEDYERLMKIAKLSDQREESNQTKDEIEPNTATIQDMAQKCPSAIPAMMIPKVNDIDPPFDGLDNICEASSIIRESARERFGMHPLKFLSSRLGKFRAASLIFSTRSFSKSNVANEFHKACDNMENVLVIIKSGQYIAGGYTEVPFESQSQSFLKYNPKLSTFVWSLNRQKLYPLQRKEYPALNCNKELGPIFGTAGIGVQDDYSSSDNFDSLHLSYSSFSSPGNVEGELFGSERFAIDEYEVFQLEH